jgi:transmembrane sensor
MSTDFNNRYSNDKRFRDMDLEQKILIRLGNFRVPEGKSEEEALSFFKLQIADKKGKTSGLHGTDIRRLTFFISSVAAMCLILFGIWFLMFRSSNEVVANKGTHIDYRLPDGSKVTINADSRIGYNKREFSKNRILKLEGEAYFDVVKGNTFQISTKYADIKVLGTSFNVYSRDNLFKVSCITGKIKVIAEDQSVEIIPGENATLKGKALVSYQEKNLNAATSWIKGEFYFEDSPLSLIFKEIERQFNVKFVVDETEEKYFTGSFTNNDLRNTLDIVCIPMGLTYEIGNRGKILIREKAK